MHFEGDGMRRLISGLLLLGAIAVGGCNEDQTPTPPGTPTPPATPTVTETFSGTLTMNGATTFPFTATAGGTVTLTLTSLAPDATLTIGLSLGTWTGSACQIVLANDAAAQAATISGTVTSAASLCARVYDPAAKVTAPMTFTVTILHP
jgi:hypothetical protein